MNQVKIIQNILHLDRPPCNNSTQFECTNRKCIAKEDLCDRFDDCYDNSDETHPDCCEYYHIITLF